MKPKKRRRKKKAFFLIAKNDERFMMLWDTFIASAHEIFDYVNQINKDGIIKKEFELIEQKMMDEATCGMVQETTSTWLQETRTLAMVLQIQIEQS